MEHSRPNKHAIQYTSRLMREDKYVDSIEYHEV